MAALGGPAQAVATHHIHTINFSFDPNEVVVDVGDTINWDNHDGVTHTVTDKNCPRAGGPGPCEFDSVFTMSPGLSFGHVFQLSAVFEYKCTIHGFEGLINVGGIAFDPDLVVAEVKFIENNAPSNVFAKRIQVTIKNEGNQGSGSTNVRVEYFYQDTWKLIGNPTINPIIPGATQTLQQTWTYTGKLGDFPIRVTADSNSVEKELDETNNEAIAFTSVLLPPGTMDGIDLQDPA